MTDNEARLIRTLREVLEEASGVDDRFSRSLAYTTTIQDAWNLLDELVPECACPECEAKRILKRGRG
jgi:hypothetical protein